MRMRIRAAAAAAVSLGASASEGAVEITCPEVRDVGVKAPAGWAPYDPDRFLEVRTAGCRTGVICAYGISGQDVNIRIGMSCPKGRTASVAGERTAICA
jgi:hypothetical protein